MTVLDGKTVGTRLRDYVLAAVKLGSRRGAFCCRTKIHKIVFLIAQEFGLRLSFTPYHYGPWSYEVDEALSALADGGLLRVDAEVREKIDGVEHAGKVYVLRLTREGEGEARRALAAMPAEIRKRIAELAKWDVWRLIGYVYVRYPQYASRSAAADDELRAT